MPVPFAVANTEAISFWHNRPELLRILGKHEGSALQGLGWSACVPKNSSIQKDQALHIFCMVCAPSQLDTVQYFEIPMPNSRLQLLMQFRMESHALLVGQGRLARPAIPWHLRRCTLCKTRALGDERHFVFDCPHFAHIRRQFWILYQDANGTLQCFMWHKDTKAVCHCLAAVLNLADDSNQDESS